MAHEHLKAILASIDTRTKVLALICLSAKVLFLASLAVLPREHIIYALIVCAVILLAMVLGVVVLERASDNFTTSGSRCDPGGMIELVQAVGGVWQFDVSRVNGPDGKPYKHRVDVELTVTAGGVKGTFIDTGRCNYREVFVVTGEMRRDRFLVLDCRTTRPGLVQFSVMVLRIGDRPDTMSGMLAGYGPVTKGIFVESVQCKRR